MKFCGYCKETKPLSDFYKRGGKEIGYRSTCKCCLTQSNVKRMKIWRHRVGISKTYNNCLGLSHTKEYKRLHRKQYKYNKKIAGKLTISTIQMVYEDNIKRFGTLTCYLCVEPIPFGKDNLEHKIPLIKGGTNEYNNLAVACQHCNNRKHSKTETEYRKEIANA